MWYTHMCGYTLSLIGHFSQKSPIISGSFARNHLQVKASYGSSPPCNVRGIPTCVGVCYTLSLIHTYCRQCVCSVCRTDTHTCGCTLYDIEVYLWKEETWRCFVGKRERKQRGHTNLGLSLKRGNMKMFEETWRCFKDPLRLSPLLSLSLSSTHIERHTYWMVPRTNTLPPIDMCVWERERDRVCVCVCERDRESERTKEVKTQMMHVDEL